MIMVSMMAARPAPRRLPVKIQLRLPNAIPRNAISTALLLRQTLPSSRKRVKASVLSSQLTYAPLVGA